MTIKWKDPNREIKIENDECELVKQKNSTILNRLRYGYHCNSAKYALFRASNLDNKNFWYLGKSS